MALRILTILLYVAATAGAQTAGLQQQVALLLEDTSKLMGLKVKRQVPAAYITKPELEKYLAAKMKEEVDPKAIATEEAVIKMLGLAPAGFDLRETTLRLLSEQAAAFYDFKLRKLYVVQPVAPEMTAELLVHELGHALQDQHFNLRRFLGRKKLDDDAALARLSVMEGQAMWLMAKFAGRPPDAVWADDSAEDDYPVLGNAPLYLRASLLFPYDRGLRFQSAVCEKENDCLTRVFRKPPQSSAQVLHPDLYFAGQAPEKVQVPPPPKGSWRQRTAGVLGEFDFFLILRTHEVDASPLGRKWRAGSYRLLENRKTKNLLLQHTSRWEDAPAAEAWFGRYQQVLRAKWTRYEVTSEDVGRLEGVGDSGRFRMLLRGKEVLIEEGLP